MTQRIQAMPTATAKRPLSVDGVRPRPAKSIDSLRASHGQIRPALKPQLIGSRPSTTAVVKSVPKPAPSTRPVRPPAPTAAVPSKPLQQPAPRTQTHAQPIPEPKAASAPIPQRPQISHPEETEPAKQTKSSKRQQLYVALALLAGGVGGFLVQAVWFGVVAIAIYGIFVFIMRIPSRTTFALAGVSIATISSLFLVKPSPELASNFATYTFMLLVIGVISLARESRPPSVRTLRDRNQRRHTRNTARA